MEITKEIQKEVEETQALALRYNDFAITTQEQYIASAEHLKLIKAKYKEIDDKRKEITRPLDEAKKKIQEFFKAPLTALERAESIIKNAMIKWQQEQEQKRREEEAQLQEMIRKEVERLEQKAIELEAKGKIEKAEVLRQQAQEKELLMPTVAPAVEKVNGIYTRTEWKFEVIDESKIPREYLIPDLQKIGAVVRATRGSLQIPGIRIYSEEIIMARRAI